MKNLLDLDMGIARMTITDHNMRKAWKRLKKLQDQPKVESIVLVINSIGGSVGNAFKTGRAMNECSKPIEVKLS